MLSTLVMLTLLPAISLAQVTPEIEASGGQLNLKVREGTNVTVSYLGTDVTSPLVSQDALFEQLSLAVETSVELGDQRIAEEVTPLSTVVSTQSSSIQALQSQVSALESMLTETQSTNADSLDVLTQSVTMLMNQSQPVCGAYPTVQNGNVYGTGQELGAVRFIECNTGFHISSVRGISTTVVCHNNGAWSDGGQTACIRATSAPTAAPTITVETVSCTVVIDNGVMAAWADGVRILPINNFNTEWINPKTFTFPSSTQVFGLQGWDNERGCQSGMAMVVCTTPSRSTKWNIVSGTTAATGGSSGGWRVRTSKGSPDPLWNVANGRARWAQANFTSLQDFTNTRVSSDWAVDWMGDNLNRFQGISNHIHASSFNPMCGGDDTPTRTDWWFRIQPQ